MKKISLSEVKPYPAPGHEQTMALRLSAPDVTGAKKFWVGLSYFLPSGGVVYGGEDLPEEKVYFCLDGEITIGTKTGDIILKPMDTLYIGPKEGRSIRNNTNKPASMLVMAEIVPK